MNQLLTTRDALAWIDENRPGWGITSDRTVRRWIYRGYLPAQQVGGQWLINLDDLESFTPPNPLGGRPMKYKGFSYSIFQRDGDWHWTVTVDDEGATVSSYTQQGDPTYGGKPSKGQAEQAVKSYINRLERIGY